MKTHVRVSLLITAFAFAAASLATAQSKPAPKTAKPPAKTAPAPKKPLAAPAEAPPPPKPAPPSDLRFKSRYTTGEEVTESVSFMKDERERYELGDIILIKQRDQKRSIQVSRAANTYLLIPDDSSAAMTAAAPRPPGVVTVTVSIVDTGERKDAFGQTARRVKTVIERTPEPGACDQTKLRTETDAWYIDVPKVMAAAPAAATPAAGAVCSDEVKTTETGDPKLVGFPISYRTSLSDLADKESTPAESSMEVTEFEVSSLDAALFEIPAGLTAAADPRALTRAISDANESKLAQGGAEAGIAEKKPGTLRVGVPEVANKTTQTVDTRALRSRIISELEEQKIEAIPMAAASQAELDARAKALGVDYLVVAEVTELKTSKPGGLTKMMKATAGEAAKDITEAKLNVQLVPPGGKARLTKNTSGKDGGVGFKTTLKVAKFAGSMYMRFYMGGMMAGQMSAMNSIAMMNVGGMGNMGAMMPMGGGRVDRTAGAASFAMQQVMAGAAMSAAQQGGPSYDAALEGAIEDAGKDVVESIKKLPAAKK